MTGIDLDDIEGGFDEPVFASQACFRAALNAMSYPGRVFPVEVAGRWPFAATPSAAQLLLSLLDAECSLWLSPGSQRDGRGAWIRFHTGCRLVERSIEADFLWIAKDDALPALDAIDTLLHGDDEDPEQSASCVVELPDDAFAPPRHGGVAAGASVQRWRLEGPGIDGQRALVLRDEQGRLRELRRQWNTNHGRFPAGVDVFLCAGRSVIGLPRTTRIDGEGS